LPEPCSGGASSAHSQQREAPTLTTVVALGGNALLRPGDRGTAAEQLDRLAATVAALAPLLADPLVLTHGNGPQVGNELLRHERAADEIPPLPLWLAVAQTQAEVGSLATIACRRASLPALTVLTHVVVSRDDPSFAEPTKPIGPFYDAQAAGRLEADRGWTLVADAGRGSRRAVASPRPCEIVELEAIRSLVSPKRIVIACGGGGIPVVRDPSGELGGIDAVIDKDLVSALLASALEAERLVILTDVDGVQSDFGTPAAATIPSLTPEEAETLAAASAAGSMRPKLEAATQFARERGRTALITSPERLRQALDGEAGTRIG
jgi:carbamate kinase